MRFLYSAALLLLLPLILIRMLLRSRRAPEYRRRIPERLGYFAPPPGDRPLLWLHAVSLGETLAARPLVERLLRELPQWRIAVTTTTPTGSAQVRKLFGDRVFHVYAPWDTPGAVRRTLQRLQPELLVLMETELWPNLLHRAQAARCRVMLANARLSARSAAGYARVGGLTRAMLASLDVIAAQSEDDRQRFLALGAPPSRVRVCGSIKFDLGIGDETRTAAGELRQAWQLAVRKVLVAASTHHPEEALVLRAFATVLKRHPRALLVLAPRHPERFRDVENACVAAGWPPCLRSRGEIPGPENPVVLLDTLGELLTFYGIADLAVIGGSFIDRGGHNPLEAAAWGVPVLSGPSLFNFEAIAAQLITAGALETVSGALETVSGADRLAARLNALLDDDSERRRRGAAGELIVASNRGAEAALYRLLRGLLKEA
jgi:3-deoxy-D-manno-octulosonic-acid transferase